MAMSPVIHFECRNAAHLATHSPGGVGEIVMHHGTFGYCAGFASDGEHRWIPTGGVSLERLIREGTEDGSDNARHIPQSIGSAGPLHLAR
jgi:hypothetical protein